MRIATSLQILASLLIVLFGSTARPVEAQQLLSGMTGPACAARGGQITTWTNTAGSGPNVGECYVPPRVSGGGGVNVGGGGGNGAAAALSALGAGLNLLNALSNLVGNAPAASSNAPEDPWDAYAKSPEYLKYKAEQDAKYAREKRAEEEALNKSTDDLESFIKKGPDKPKSADQCSGFAPGAAGVRQCYQTAAASLERQAANCTGSCKAAMLRAAASARCVAALQPTQGQIDSAVNSCARDPSVGLKAAPAARTQVTSVAPSGRATSGASQARPAASAKPSANAPAKPANAQQASAQTATTQRGRWIAPGDPEECKKLAQNSFARNTAGYYDLCVSDPPSRSAGPTTKARAPTRRTAAALPLPSPPSPLSDFGCNWYGGSLRPDGSCWVIGVTTDDCLNDLYGRVAEDGGYKYCVMGGGPGGGKAPRLAAAPTSSPDEPTAPPDDDALDECRDGAAAPWTVAGCYDLLGQPAAQNRPGALAASLRASLERGMQESRAAARQRKEQAEESAEEAAVAAQLYRDWRADAARRYDRWVDEGHPFVAENAAARDACTGRWTYDGTSAGSCDPEQSRARWELTFKARQPPSPEEEERVASSGLPWRTNSETDCRNAGGIPVRPVAENDITGIPAQLLDDPTVDQDALRRSFLCYQTIGRDH